MNDAMLRDLLFVRLDNDEVIDQGQVMGTLELGYCLMQGQATRFVATLRQMSEGRYVLFADEAARATWLAAYEAELATEPNGDAQLVLPLLDGVRTYDAIAEALGWYSDAGVPNRTKVHRAIKALCKAGQAKMRHRKAWPA